MVPVGGLKNSISSEEETTYERIRRIAARLFAKSGYQAVGVAELGDAVGLGRGALYYHIGSKEDLLFDIMSRYISDLVDDGRRILSDQPDGRQRIRSLSRHLMQAIAANLSEMTVCFRDIHTLSQERRQIVAQKHLDYQELWEQTVQDGVAQGLFKPISVVALKGLLGMYFYSFLWLDPQGSQKPEEIADEFADLVLSALTKDVAAEGQIF